MELHGVVHGGTFVPDDTAAMPADGTRVVAAIEPAPATETPPPVEAPKTFGERYARFRGAVSGLPADLAAQHDHYRLGTPKR